MPTSADVLVRALRALAANQRLGEELIADAFAAVMRGEATPAQVGGLLTGLRVQGESADEIAGAVRALRAAMIPVSLGGLQYVVDTCGTGGGEVGTFNISTASAFVAVAAGARVAKHGNRSYTSRCGSADVLEALGITITVEPDQAGRLLRTVGMAFLFAPSFHPAMRHVAPVRRDLGITTLMNVIGPLANPASVRRQVIGIADAALGPVIAEVLRRLGTEHALVVHGTAGMDEIAPWGKTKYWEVRGGEITEDELEPGRFGLRVEDPARLAGGDPAANATRIERLLAEPRRDAVGRAAVALNAGAALYVSGGVDSMGNGMAAAIEALDGTRGSDVLESLRREAPVSTFG
jgi:anthranilate phosphoribosyltransferase